MTRAENPEEALRIHDGFVRALARSLLADKTAAEDVAQDTWVAALERGAAAVSLPRWLAGVVRKRAGKHVRTEQRRQRRERSAARGEGAPSDEEILAREAVRAEVVAAVLALDEPYRECVLLRFYEELPPRAIAVRLGMPVETVRTRLKRALEMLRARLDREHGGGREAWSLALLPWASSGAGSGGAWPVLVLPLALGAGVAGLAAFLFLRPGEEEAAPTTLVAAATPVEPVPASASAEPPAAAERQPVDTPVAEALRETTGALRTQVYWSDGTPASGLQARLERYALESPFFRAARGVVDSGGELRFEALAAGSYGLTLDRNAHERVEIEAGRETELTLTLARGFDVAALVVDRAGRPVAGAELWLSDVNAFTGAFVGTTGTDGRFELRSCVSGQELGAFAAGHAPSLLTGLSAEEGARLEVRLVLPAEGGEVAGVVLGPEGEPVPGAQVLVGSEQHEFRRTFVPGEGELAGTVAPPQLVRTDETGRFRVRGVPLGHVPLVARAEGCALWRTALTLEASVPAEVRIELELEASLAGVVRDGHGVPLARAWVRPLGRIGLLDPSVSTGADGVYRLGGLAAGQSEFEVRVSDAGSARATLELARGEARSWDPVVGLGVELVGRVLDAGGAPLEDWTIEVVGEARVASPSFGSARTDADGRFRVKSLTDGTYRVTLDAPGSPVAVLELGGVRPGGAELELRVPDAQRPSAHVRGRIVDGSGAVPANVALELATSNLGLPSECGPDGAFELGPLVPTLYALRVRAAGYPEVVLGPRRLAPEETWELGVIVLTPAATLVVRAERPADAAPFEPWFRVHRAGDDGLFDLGPVEASGGEWRREALAPGRHVLQVAGNGVASALVPFTLEPGETRVLALDLRRGLPRELVLRTATDLGFARVRLRVWAPAGELVLDDELFPRSPGDYRAFFALEPGPHRVVAELPGGARCETELVIDPLAPGPLVLELR